MQVTTSITLTVLHDGQFWIGIFEHADEGRYGACRVVFGAAEPTDVELVAFIVRRWTTLAFDMAADPSATADAMLSHANPKRRQREARKLVERAGVGTKAQQAMSVSYEARKIDPEPWPARLAKRKPSVDSLSGGRNESRSIAESRGLESSFSLDALRGVPLPALRRERSCEGTRAGGRFASLPVYIRGNIFHARYTQSKRPKRARQKGG